MTRAERRRQVRADWQVWRDPGQWPKGKVPAPRRARRMLWREGLKESIWAKFNPGGKRP